MFQQTQQFPHPQSRNLRRIHLPDSDQIVHKVPSGVGLSVFLIGGVSHPDVVEAFNTDLERKKREKRENGSSGLENGRTDKRDILNTSNESLCMKKSSILYKSNVAFDLKSQI